MSFWNCLTCFRFSNSNNNNNNNVILDYCNCTLNDIPLDVLKNERTLEELLLSSNRISIIPSELCYCQNLKILKLNDNELEEIPNTIGMLRNLQQLDCSRNVINSIPDNIKSCKNLTYLDLSLNNLQRLPDAITQVITLKELYLNETYLEFLPADMGHLINLKILELRSNNLITLPKSISKLVSLNRIDIGGNEFTELPEVIGNLIQLNELWIDSNRIRRISCNISNLLNLIHFEANNNQLTTLPNEISNWKNLEILSISFNDIEYLPFSIGMLKNLIILKCDGNKLKKLPDSICNLLNLEELIINNNYIIRLPNTIGILNKLIYLSIDYNLIRRLPNELCNCNNLKILNAHNNKLCELPIDIGNLKNLYVLNIINNFIIYLPISILNLKNLQALWLNDNQIQPLIPLQYYDCIDKTQLTCILLPQQQKQLNEHQQEIISNDNNYNDINNGSANSLIYLQQQQLNLINRNCIQQQRNINNNDIDNNGVIVRSPSRRICFADESTTIITNNNEQNQNNNINATTAIPTTVITTRLMRSPTPYPKELRLMAKYVRNQSTTNQLNFKNNIETIDEQQQQINDVKEAGILINPNNLINQDNQYHQLSNNDILQSATIDTISVGNKQPIYMYGNNSNIISNYMNTQNQHQELSSFPINNEKNIENFNNIINDDIIYDTYGKNMITISKLPPSGRIQQQQHNFNNTNTLENYITTPLPLQLSHSIHLQSQDNNNCQFLDKLSNNSFINYNNDNHVSNSNIYQQQQQLHNYDIKSTITNYSSTCNSQNQQSLKPIDNNHTTENYCINDINNESMINDCTNNIDDITINEYIINNDRGQPPPYHIAKNFTKKSQKDLLNYDTIRNHNEYINNSIDNNDDNINYIKNNELEKINDDNNKFIMSINDCDKNLMKNCNLNNLSIINNNINNGHNIINSDQNNDNVLNKRENELIDNDCNIIQQQQQICTTAANTINGNHKINIRNFDDNNDELYLTNNINISIDNQIDCNNTETINDDSSFAGSSTTINNENDDIKQKNLEKRSKTPNTNQWLFGLHKNPTVKQVIVRKDPALGFEIKPGQHQGIFVSITLPNTSASSLLRINDKILDVDGFDFTKIPYEKAKEVLMESGPTLNIMISRK